MKLLAYKPALMHVNKKDGTVKFYPTTNPEWEWPLTSIVNFTCRNGHTEIDPDCGCGIQVSFSTRAMRQLWEQAKKRDYPLVITIVQALGDIVLDDSTKDARVSSMYFWGLVVPKWIEYGNLYKVIQEYTHRQMMEAYENGERVFWRPAIYRSVREAHEYAMLESWIDFKSSGGKL